MSTSEERLHLQRLALYLKDLISKPKGVKNLTHDKLPILLSERKGAKGNGETDYNTLVDGLGLYGFSRKKKKITKHKLQLFLKALKAGPPDSKAEKSKNKGSTSSNPKPPAAAHDTLLPVRSESSSKRASATKQGHNSPLQAPQTLLLVMEVFNLLASVTTDPSLQTLLPAGLQKIATSRDIYYVLLRPGVRRFLRELGALRCGVFLYTNCDDDELIHAIIVAAGGQRICDVKTCPGSRKMVSDVDHPACHNALYVDTTLDSWRSDGFEKEHPVILLEPFHPFVTLNCGVKTVDLLWLLRDTALTDLLAIVKELHDAMLDSHFEVPVMDLMRSIANAVFSGCKILLPDLPDSVPLRHLIRSHGGTVADLQKHHGKITHVIWDEMASSPMYASHSLAKCHVVQAAWVYDSVKQLLRQPEENYGPPGSSPVVQRVSLPTEVEDKEREMSPVDSDDSVDANHGSQGPRVPADFIRMHTPPPSYSDFLVAESSSSFWTPVQPAVPLTSTPPPPPSPPPPPHTAETQITQRKRPLDAAECETERPSKQQCVAKPSDHHPSREDQPPRRSPGHDTRDIITLSSGESSDTDAMAMEDEDSGGEDSTADAPSQFQILLKQLSDLPASELRAAVPSAASPASGSSKSATTKVTPPAPKPPTKATVAAAAAPTSDHSFEQPSPDSPSLVPLLPQTIVPAESIVRTPLPSPAGTSLPNDLDVQLYTMKAIICHMQSLQVNHLHAALLQMCGICKRSDYAVPTMRRVLLQRAEVFHLVNDHDKCEWVSITSAAYDRLIKEKVEWPDLLFLNAVAQTQKVNMLPSMNIVHVLLGINVGKQLNSWARNYLTCWGLGQPTAETSAGVSKTQLFRRIQEYWLGVAQSLVQKGLLRVLPGMGRPVDFLLHSFHFGLTDKGKDVLLLGVVKFEERAAQKREFLYPELPLPSLSTLSFHGTR